MQRFDENNPLIETGTITKLSPARMNMGESFVDGVPKRKFFYLEGLFLQGDVRNHNGRIYPTSEIEKAVQRLNEKIMSAGPVAGEMDHPEGMNLNFKEIAVLITEMSMKGNNGYGKMRVIPGGCGDILTAFLEAGGKVGVSSRGTGNVDANGVVSDFDIVTIDVVLSPSAPNAYPVATFESLSANSEPKRNNVLRLVDHSNPDLEETAQIGSALKKLIEHLGDNDANLRRV